MLLLVARHRAPEIEYRVQGPYLVLERDEWEARGAGYGGSMRPDPSRFGVPGRVVADL
jgi:hypothetical protein